ncbi:hypothetical protein [Mycobacterium riyadhense]|uniref:Uncharacterized protein n=1 Tax=Mycobacterium riyadhense TaxID=486698 RepID=A0A1X2BHG5_9MYCO|nr:hypothetical protein [Mycobacterium riyadhense]MCV7146037.1 hypothetical protein [Mycobacterium riyadhense]ORW63058.1 hypothetical protein AWC22_03675 [Mycobacterium riyadhense]
MRLVAESGLWTTGRPTAPWPLAAVLEVSGAVLSWTIDEQADAIHITFTDVSRADWLWRVVGQSGYVDLVSALGAAAPDEPRSIDLTGVDIAPGSLAPLRRLAVGHWLRRWWPASQRDGIAGLDHSLLDVEIATLTAGAQDFFTDDTLDSDVAELLAPHAASLMTYLRSDDERVRKLVRAGVEIADEVGIDVESSTALDIPTGRQDDYALAAGTDGNPLGSATIARGVASISWAAVPPGVFDAAEDTVSWSVEAAGAAVVAVVRAAVVGPDPATGIPVRVRSGDVRGTGALGSDGHATLPLVDAAQRPVTESSAWNHDWPTTSVVIGADLAESRQTRDRIRSWARARLDRPPDDAFLAEILAAESAY